MHDVLFPMTIIQQLVTQKSTSSFLLQGPILLGPSATLCFYVVGCFSGVNTNTIHFSMSFITMLNGDCGTPLMTSLYGEDYLFPPSLPNF